MWRGEAVITANPARLVLIKVGWLVGWSWSFLLQTNRRAALVATALVSLMSALMQGAAYLIDGIIIMIAFKKNLFFQAILEHFASSDGGIPWVPTH